MKGRPYILLFALALLMTLSFAQTFNSEPYLYAEETEDSVEIEKLASGYDLITISGERTFVLFENQIVEDESAIRDALRGHYITNALPSPAEQDEVMLLANQFNATRNLMSRFGVPSEDLCVNHAGLNIFKGTALGIGSPSPYCYDHQTCTCPPWLVCGLTDQIPYATEAKIIHGRYLFALDQNLTELQTNIYGVNIDNAHVLLDAAVDNLYDMKRAAKFLNSSILQISGSMGSCVSSNLDPEYVDELQNTIPENVRGMFLSVNPVPFCVDLCPDVTINISILDDAIEKAEIMLERAAPLGDVTGEAAAILERTRERREYLQTAESNRAYRLIYSNVSAQLDHIHRLTNVTAIRNAVLNDVVTLEVLSEQIENSIDTGNFELSEDLVNQFNNRSEALQARLSRLVATYSKADVAKKRVEREILRAEFNIGPNELGAREEINDYKDLKFNIDARFKSTASLNDFTVLELNYTQLGDSLENFNDGLESLHASQVGTIAAGATRGAMQSTFSLWNSFSPMTPSQKSENARMMPALLIGAADVFFVVLVLGIFAIFAFVNKRIVWHRQVAMTWAAIFLVFFALVGAASLGLHELVLRNAEEPTSFGLFYSSLAGSNTSAVTYDLSNLTQSQILALQSCTSKIRTSLDASNITSSTYILNGNACKVGTESKTRDECVAELSEVPHFTLQFGYVNKTSFFTFYQDDAVVEGDARYIEKCEISQVL